jgi:GT2 family glycosyltransferase
VRSLWVVVLNWNGLADTRRCLPTLAACRMPAGWRLHVLVVDNGSTDGSAVAIAREFPGVDCLPLSENRRFAGGNTAGVAHALAGGADAIALLNNDTEADPALFAKLLAALDENPDAGAVAPLIYFGAPSQRIWYAGARCIPALGFTQHRGVRVLDHGQFRSIETTGYLTGCCLLAPRAVWEAVGMLDERYFIYAEDADWCLRARRAGYRLLFVPTGRLWHAVSASSGAASPWKIYQRLRANLLLFETHAEGIGRLTWLPSFLAQQLVLMIVLIARGQTPAAMAVPRALWDAATGKPAGEFHG